MRFEFKLIDQLRLSLVKCSMLKNTSMSFEIITFTD